MHAASTHPGGRRGAVGASRSPATPSPPDERDRTGGISRHRRSFQMDVTEVRVHGWAAGDVRSAGRSPLDADSGPRARSTNQACPSARTRRRCAVAGRIEDHHRALVDGDALLGRPAGHRGHQPRERPPLRGVHLDGGVDQARGRRRRSSSGRGPRRCPRRSPRCPPSRHPPSRARAAAIARTGREACVRRTRPPRPRIGPGRRSEHAVIGRRQTAADRGGRRARGDRNLQRSIHRAS